MVIFGGCAGLTVAMSAENVLAGGTRLSRVEVRTFRDGHTRMSLTFVAFALTRATRDGTQKRHKIFNELHPALPASVYAPCLPADRDTWHSHRDSYTIHQHPPRYGTERSWSLTRLAARCARRCAVHLTRLGLASHCAFQAALQLDLVGGGPRHIACAVGMAVGQRRRQQRT